MQRELDWLCGASRNAIALLVLVIAFACDAVVAAPLDAEDLVREAVLRNHDLKAARAQVEAALGRLKQAGLWPNPRLDLSNETDRPFANQGEYSQSIGFSQDFPISGRLGRAEDVARVDVARALAEVNEAERKLMGDVAAAFYNVAVIDQKQLIRDRLIAALEGLVAASKARFRAGDSLDLAGMQFIIRDANERHVRKVEIVRKIVAEAPKSLVPSGRVSSRPAA
jgi:cobalt-zinc-cadmium efflux system outer membrane protein